MDAHTLYESLAASRSWLLPWVPWIATIRDETAALAYIREMQQREEEQAGITLGIFVEDTLAGSIAMQQWDHMLSLCRIGFWCKKDYGGKGLMYQSARTFIDFLFRETGMNRIEIHCIPGNQKSLSLATRLGFKTEAFLRQATLHNGKAEDLVILGLLKEDWPSAVTQHG